MGATLPSIRELVRSAAELLSASDSAQLDAQLLLCKVLAKERSWLYAWPERTVSATEQEDFRRLVLARQQGQPIAYLLGTREFWSLQLEVNPTVLIPRPETELLVEAALRLCAQNNVKPVLVADLGTGSGAIALALASEQGDWQVYATDSSTEALAVAERNRERLDLANVHLLEGSWCDPLPPLLFTMIISNPPYIAASDRHLAQGDVRFEPRSALVAQEEGLQDIRQIAEQALPRLADQGWLLLEHGWQQGPATRAILTAQGYLDVVTEQDNNGHDRITLGRKP